MRGWRWGVGALTLALGSVVAASPAQTGDGDGRFALKGVGVATCVQFVRDAPPNSPAYRSFLNWIDGYTTAVNALSPGLFDSAAWESADVIARIVQATCTTRPEAKFGVVAGRVLARVARDGLTTYSDLVAVEANGRPILLYRATLRRMHQRLAEQGLYDGPPDARFAVASKAALKAFQSREGLPTTGLPDQVTLWKLFRP